MLQTVIRFMSCAAVIAGLQFPTAWAADEPYEFDRGHTRIFFEVDHMGFSGFRGMFHEYSGSFTFNEKDLSKSKVDVTIDMASADMYFAKMNEHLMKPDLLDVAKYPQARFVSTKVSKTGDDTAQMVGKLTMHGKTQPVTLDVKFNRADINPASKKFTRGFTASGVIDRSAFGIDYGIPYGVSKDVRLTIMVEAVRKDPPEKL